ncbi:SOS response-associated peptidase [Demequina oxidasica]|uniref:SOS response-associated peptidase n=1 Tax=Demequina oxidasica TaxID=676199 RepID=UPI0007809F29|nr:SOS response-associated peptidase [Demequina oxidasica]
MCGRYANFLSDQELIDAFEIATLADDARLLGPSWNVAPTQKVILVTASKDDPSQRIGETAKWGLVPSWAKDPSVGSRMINARGETVAEKPSFRSAFAKRRCLVPASGYYEWHTEGGVKTPHYIHSPDDAPLAFAGLYEFWREKGSADDAPWLATCTIVTTAARDEMRELHDRQPVMLTDDQRNAWLDPASDKDTLLDVIAAPAQKVEWYAIGKAVGNVRNNSAELLEPADS